MSCLSIKVEVNNGSSVQQASKDAISLAIKLGLCVEFQFNEVSCFAYPDGDWRKLVEGYFKAIEPVENIKAAFSEAPSMVS